MPSIGAISATPAPLNLWVGPVDPRLSIDPNFDLRSLSANAGYCHAFQVTRPITVSHVTYMTGSAASGNIDLGIYADGTGGNRLGSVGGAAVGSAFVVHLLDLTAPVTLVPGVRYWAAWSCDNTTARFAGPVAYGGSATMVGTGLASVAVSEYPLGTGLDTTAGGNAPLILLFFT